MCNLHSKAAGYFLFTNSHFSEVSMSLNQLLCWWFLEVVWMWNHRCRQSDELSTWSTNHKYTECWLRLHGQNDILLSHLKLFACDPLLVLSIF